MLYIDGEQKNLIWIFTPDTMREYHITPCIIIRPNSNIEFTKDNQSAIIIWRKNVSLFPLAWLIIGA